MIQLRRDYTLDKFVILPETNKATTGEKCPYCPGNELMTGTSILSLVIKDGMLKKLSDSDENVIRDWSVRVFSSNRPVVNTSVGNHYTDKPLYSEPAYGYHYIVVATPNHGEDFASLSVDQWSNVLLVLQNQIGNLYSQKSVTYVSIFVNSGNLSGAHESHSHFNLVTLSTIPPTIESEAKASNHYLNENGNCPACNIIAAESEGPRQILVTDHYIALSPWASTYPHEFWIYPKRHITSFSKISQREISDLALILRSTLGGMYRILNKPSYNIVFHLSPEKKNSRQIHWHVEVYPQLSSWSGLERGFGIFVNEISPESSTATLGPECRKEFANLNGIT